MRMFHSSSDFSFSTGSNPTIPRSPRPAPTRPSSCSKSRASWAVLVAVRCHAHQQTRMLTEISVLPAVQATDRALKARGYKGQPSVSRLHPSLHFAEVGSGVHERGSFSVVTEAYRYGRWQATRARNQVSVHDRGLVRPHPRLRRDRPVACR